MIPLWQVIVLGSAVSVAYTVGYVSSYLKHRKNSGDEEA
jgi:hypothetical protein